MNNAGQDVYSTHLIESSFLDIWQQMLDLLAALMKIRAALIVRRNPGELEIFVNSRNQDNPYRAGQREPLVGSSRYCEWVIIEKKPLVVPNALADPAWRNGVGAAKGMVSYMGLPIRRPDGEIFGTICVLDVQTHGYSETELALLTRFRDLAEAHLSVVYERQRADQKERDLETLSQLLPICTFCKSVASADGSWVPVETYLDKHVRERLTHGLCPRCYEARMAPYRNAGGAQTPPDKPPGTMNR